MPTKTYKNANAKPLFLMPAEWEAHEATWLSWPTNKTTWPGNLLKEVEVSYLQMMQGLLPHEKVNLLVPDIGQGKKVAARLETLGAATHRLVLHPIKTVDAWIRDYGPIFVKDDKDTAFTKWVFNAWGGKYSDLARDNGVVDEISSLVLLKRVDIPMPLEGGSIDVNGRGTCLTTEQCLLNANRNPKLTRMDIENRIKKYLGVEKMIWLKEGIEGDDTDGHVDDVARFVNTNTVVIAVESDAKDKNHSILKENLNILKNERTHEGKKFDIIELPMPGRVSAKHPRGIGDRLPASYANFYIANGVVLLPVYSHANDKAAVKILKKVFPTRKIIPIECSALVHGLGSIHCVTQQQPQ